MKIQRDLYLNKLIRKQQNGMIKVITGIRRCGKSYLLNTLFYDYLISQGINESHIIKFAFDSASDLKSIGESLLDMEREKRGANPELFLSYMEN